MFLLWVPEKMKYSTISILSLFCLLILCDVTIKKCSVIFPYGESCRVNGKLYLSFHMWLIWNYGLISLPILKCVCVCFFLIFTTSKTFGWTFTHKLNRGPLNLLISDGSYFYIALRAVVEARGVNSR